MVAVLLVLTGIAAFLPSLIKNYFLTNREQELVVKGNELVNIMDRFYSGQLNQDQLNQFLNSTDRFLNSRIWIIDGQLNLVAASQEQPLADSAGDCTYPIKENPLHWMEQHQHMMGMMNGHRMHHLSAPPSSAETPPAASPPISPVQTNLSLENLTGMNEIIQTIQKNSGQPWSATYYHPYYEENMLIVGVPLVRSDGTIGGTILLNTRLAEIDHFLARIYHFLLAAALLACLLAALLANWLSGHIMKPLKAMQRTASDMAGGNYASRVTLLPKDEIGDLGKSLNVLGKELEDFVNQMNAMDKTRRDFVANVSHELRTPLTIIRGYNEALLDKAITAPEQVERYHRIMRDEAVRLEKLIGELLDLSRLQSTDAAALPEPVSLREIVENVLVLMEGRSNTKQVSLTAAVPPEPLEILGEGDRIMQLVLILVDNAIKFTPSGGKVAVELTKEPKEINLKISDTGKGIAEEDLPFIWDRFYKGDKSRTRSEGGTGLGLAIAKAILERHQAKFSVTSRLGAGTTFMIRFKALSAS